MHDDVDFDVPLGRLLFRFVARDLRAVFTYRHDALVRALALPPAAPPEIRLSAG